MRVKPKRDIEKEGGVVIDQSELLEFMETLNQCPSPETVDDVMNKDASGGSAEKNSAKSDTTSSTPRNSQNSEESSVQTDNTNYDRTGSTDSSPGIAEILSDPNLRCGLLPVAKQTSSDGSIDFSKIRNIKTEEEEPMEGDISTLKRRRILNKDELRDSLCLPSSKKKKVTALTVDTKSSVVQKLKFSDLSPHMSRSTNTLRVIPLLGTINI